MTALDNITSSHFGLGSAEELRMRSLDILIEAFRYFATRFDAGYRIKLEYVLGALSRALTRATLKV